VKIWTSILNMTGFLRSRLSNRDLLQAHDKTREWRMRRKTWKIRTPEQILLKIIIDQMESMI
jgi:hypothetical protein